MKDIFLKTNNKIKNFKTKHRLWYNIFLIVFLLVIVLAGSVIFGKFIQSNSVIEHFDEEGYELFQHIPRLKILEILIFPFNFDFLAWSGRKPSYIYVFVGLFLLYIFLFKRKKLIPAIIALVIGSFIIVFVAEVDWHFIFRSRPFLHLPNIVDDFSKNAWKHWSSYPSGHTRETALYSTIIAAFIPQLTGILAGFVVFIALSRLYVGAHYPTDVIAAMIIGFLVGRIAIITMNEIMLLLKKLFKNTHVS